VVVVASSRHGQSWRLEATTTIELIN